MAQSRRFLHGQLLPRFVLDEALFALSHRPLRCMGPAVVWRHRWDPKAAQATAANNSETLYALHIQGIEFRLSKALVLKGFADEGKRFVSGVREF